MAMAVFTRLTVFKHCYQHNDEVIYLTLRHLSPDFNIIEPLWDILESNARVRFPSLCTLGEHHTNMPEE